MGFGQLFHTAASDYKREDDYILRGHSVTSSMTEQMCRTHWVMACGAPEMVTALSVESGSMSPATCTWAPVVCNMATGADRTRGRNGEKTHRTQGVRKPYWHTFI